jgi:hypothetical protein
MNPFLVKWLVDQHFMNVGGIVEKVKIRTVGDKVTYSVYCKGSKNEDAIKR